MAASNTTLASLWDDGQGSPLKTIQHGTPSKIMTTSTEIKDDVLRYYKDNGLETMAREVGIVDPNGEIVTFKDQNMHPKAEQIIVLQSSPYKHQLATTQHQFVTASPQTISQQTVLLSGTQHHVIPAQMLKAGQFLATPIKVEPQRQWSQGVPRKRPSDIYDDYGESKRKKGDKGGKGLRHFSMKVCEKVKKKGVTTYNEVADELVTEFSEARHHAPGDHAYDQKNIRRRVYDALNVLMAMNIISKEKKEIRWIGLPTNCAQECQNLEMEKERRKERIRHKTHQLQELILQQIAFKNLVQRNRQLQAASGLPTSNSAIQLPFIIVNTSKKTVIDCSISNDKYEYLFNFDNTFEIHDDIEVLKRMGMAYGLEKGQCTGDDLGRATKLVPRALETYVYEMARVATPVAVAGTSGLGSRVSDSSAASYGAVRGLASLVAGGATPHLDRSLDAEVAMATSQLSRQSSVTSYSDLPSVHDSPDEDYSDASDSERSSPADFH